jgi:hypothetical protein
MEFGRPRLGAPGAGRADYLSRTQTVDGSTDRETAAQPGLSSQRAIDGPPATVQSLSKVPPRIGRTSERATRKTRSPSGFLRKRLMGLEPTTFCMASSC